MVKHADRHHATIQLQGGVGPEGRLGSNGRVRVCFSDGGFRRNRRLQPKTALSRFPPVDRADFERQQRVVLTRSPSRRRTTGICAEGTAGVDASQPFAGPR